MPPLFFPGAFVLIIGVALSLDRGQEQAVIILSFLRFLVPGGGTSRERCRDRALFTLLFSLDIRTHYRKWEKVKMVSELKPDWLDFLRKMQRLSVKDTRCARRTGRSVQSKLNTRRIMNAEEAAMEFQLRLFCFSELWSCQHNKRRFNIYCRALLLHLNLLFFTILADGRTSRKIHL